MNRMMACKKCGALYRAIGPGRWRFENGPPPRCPVACSVYDLIPAPPKDPPAP